MLQEDQVELQCSICWYGLWWCPSQVTAWFWRGVLSQGACRDSQSSVSLPMSKTDDTLVPPDMSQPVLLEVQAISINKVVAKVMFDNGSTAALVTHHFAQRAGLLEQKVA